jgi:hypothetical protein
MLHGTLAELHRATAREATAQAVSAVSARPVPHNKERQPDVERLAGLFMACCHLELQFVFVPLFDIMKPFTSQTLDRQPLRLHELDALLSASDVVSDMTASQPDAETHLKLAWWR